MLHGDKSSSELSELNEGNLSVDSGSGEPGHAGGPVLLEIGCGADDASVLSASDEGERSPALSESQLLAALAQSSKHDDVHSPGVHEARAAGAPVAKPADPPAVPLSSGRAPVPAASGVAVPPPKLPFQAVLAQGPDHGAAAPPEPPQ